MIKVLLREAVLTAVALLLVSVAAFAALDLTLRPDWFGLVGFADAVSLPRERLLARDLPLLWNRDALDAAQRTERDITALGAPSTAAQAAARIIARGTAALPVALARMPTLDPVRQQRVLHALAALETTIGEAEAPPTPRDAADLAAARRYWERYEAAHGLDFRTNYANRQAARMAGRESRNANERLLRLGTYALPSIFRALNATADLNAQSRLVNALADITAIPLRLDPSARPDAVRFAVEAWRAWWFATQTEYATFAPWQRNIARALDTRYGRWLFRAARGRLGLCGVTGRPISQELRERLPVSALTSGLGGLLGTGIAIAFGGAAALRKRSRREKLLDLAGAVFPGLIALIAGWLLLARVMSPSGAVGPTVLRVSEGVGAARFLAATALSALLPAAWLLRARSSPFLDAARVEAESWTLRGQSPSVRRALRHGARIAVASLLCPLGLAAPIVLLASMLVELGLGVRGMGALTLRAVFAPDGAWLLVATLTVVPILLARRWSMLALVWVLGTRPDGRVRRFRGASLPAPPRATESDA